MRASTLRRAAGLLDAQANRLLEQADELVLRARDMKADARRIRAMIEEEADVEAAREWWGADVDIVAEMGA